MILVIPEEIINVDRVYVTFGLGYYLSDLVFGWSEVAEFLDFFKGERGLKLEIGEENETIVFVL